MRAYNGQVQSVYPSFGAGYAGNRQSFRLSVSNRSMKAWCILLAIAMCPISALACSCPAVDHACEAYRSVPVIFTGTVTDLGSRETNSKNGSYSQEIQFSVDESFKGTSTSRITVTRVHVQSSCPSNAPEFVVGERFSVWAFPDQEGKLAISDCTPTQRIEDAAQFISELRELRAGGGATYIFGDVYRSRIFPNGVKPEDLENYSSLPLAGTKVVVSSHDGRYTAVADEKGRFVVPLERGGEYRVVVDLPKYFAQEGLDREIDLEDHDCADMSVWTQYVFSFKGRVIDLHGVPIAGVAVELLSATTLESFAHNFTNSYGDYELPASEPGDYLIAVNWDEPPAKETPFATVLYPGVHDIETASHVHTEEAGAVVLSDFHLATPAKCTVQIQIEDQNGKSTTDARIMTKYFPQQFWHPIVDVDSGGTATVTVIGPNLIYMVASRTLSNQQELRSEVKTIKSCPVEPIRLRLTNTIRVD